jgi:cytoskeletal protein CcmA (bactofilin family)
MARSNDFDTNTINTIGAGTSLKGDIVSDGDFRIVGKVVGSIQSKGKIVIGKNGLVEGDIVCKNADISGKLIGSLKAEELLSLTTSGHIEGEVTAGKIAIEAGAVFTGQCQMLNKVDEKRSKK